jgi:hypothetical protein
MESIPKKIPIYRMIEINIFISKIEQYLIIFINLKDTSIDY